MARAPALVPPAVAGGRSDWPASASNYRSHALVCLLAAATLFVHHFLGARIRRGWQFAGIVAFGLVFAYVMPIAARAGLFGPALQRKTIEQEATDLPLLLAGRTEPPMTITAIIERPLLGWGSAMNCRRTCTPRPSISRCGWGSAPTFPFEAVLAAAAQRLLRDAFDPVWVPGPKAACWPCSCRRGCWSPASASSGTTRGSDVWAPLGLTVALQGIWDLLYGPWTYNMVPEYACIALLFCAVHFRGRELSYRHR